MVSWDARAMSGVAAGLRHLAADGPHMQRAAGTAAGTPLPAAGSAAERALSSRPEIVAAVTAVVTLVQNQVDTLAANVTDTLDAYQRGEAENIDAINKLWDDIGASTARNGQRSPDPRPIVPMAFPSTLFTPFEPKEPPSELPYKIVDLAEFVTSIPTNVEEILRKVWDITVLFAPGDPAESQWTKVALGQYQPISLVGNVYEQMGDVYIQAAEQLQYLGEALLLTWTGDSSDLAGNYFYTMYSWLRWEVAEGFHYVGAQYQDTAHSLYIHAARAAGEIADYKDVLWGLVQDFAWDVAEGLRPDHILVKELGAIAKTAAKRILVINTLLKVLQISLDLLERLRLNVAITPMAIRPPLRR